MILKLCEYDDFYRLKCKNIQAGFIRMKRTVPRETESQNRTRPSVSRTRAQWNPCTCRRSRRTRWSLGWWKWSQWSPWSWRSCGWWRSTSRCQETQWVRLSPSWCFLNPQGRAGCRRWRGRCFWAGCASVCGLGTRCSALEKHETNSRLVRKGNDWSIHAHTE